MNVEILDAYVAWSHCYMGNDIIGISLDKSTAETMAKGQGEWGSDGLITTRKIVKITQDDKETIFLIDSKMQMPVTLDLNIPEQRKQIKQNALNKLDPVEREILGIK